ncbi:MAG TPA: tetratricopeptide repeat protein [Bryobacteraceae bacterium]
MGIGALIDCPRCGKANPRELARCSTCEAPLADLYEAETLLTGEARHAGPSDARATWGPFRLIEKVGQGSFGQVYRAFDTKLEREVALKLLLPGFGSDTRAVLREARRMARVRHPNVVPVYGVDSFDGRVGFWSDFVNGRTLAALLATQGRFGPKEAAVIGIDVCKAVNAVHAAGLLHRDIKAANVMREEGGRILLMDFGLSLEHAERHLPGGTPAYMAPELFAGASASVASDIYALGVLLYQLLTAKYPVDPSQYGDPRARRSLHDERTDLPEALVGVVETALAADPARRFASAGQMIASLAEAAGLAPVTASQLALASPPQARRSRIWLLAPAVAVLAIAVWFTPLRYTLFPHLRIAVPGKDAHADYLKAQDLLDHYYQPRSMERAIAIFKRTIVEDPRFALAYAGLGRAYYQQFRDLDDPSLIAKVQEACSQALAIDRDLATAHVTLGMLYMQTSRIDLASQELEEALKLDVKSAEGWAATAELYSRQGRIQDVEPAFQKAIDLAPTDWRWPQQLGFFHLSNGHFEEAARYYSQAAELTPDNARVLNSLGIAYRRMSRFPEAEATLKKAIELEPRDSYLSNLGLVYEQQGRYTDAVGLYRRATELNPSNYLAFANLASVYDRIPEEKPKAKETYLKAISLAEELRESNPKDATLLSRIGSYYATLGMKEKSVPLLRQAAALDPDDPQVLYRAAEGYELLHNRSEALRWIRLALEHKYSLEALKRNPEMKELLADPRFATIANTVR